MEGHLEEEEVVCDEDEAIADVDIKAEYETIKVDWERQALVRDEDEATAKVDTEAEFKAIKVSCER